MLGQCELRTLRLCFSYVILSQLLFRRCILILNSPQDVNLEVEWEAGDGAVGVTPGHQVSFQKDLEITIQILYGHLSVF